VRKRQLCCFCIDVFLSAPFNHDMPQAISAALSVLLFALSPWRLVSNSTSVSDPHCLACFACDGALLLRNDGAVL
jgi:hypothetical protein